MNSKTVSATIVLALVALAGVAPASGATAKPLSYIYGKCLGVAEPTTPCFEASVLPTQTKLTLSGRGECRTANYALAYLGLIKVKRGTFSVTKTVNFSADGYTKESAQVQISGTLRPGKSVKGTIKITAAPPECASISGVAKPFSLKFWRANYGG